MQSSLTQLHNIRHASGAKVDIVFIHGLDGDAYDTWSFRRTESWHSWISRRFPTVGIWSLSYRLRSSNWFRGAIPLRERAINVAATIASELGQSSRIIFICHSYGGLLAKEIARVAGEKAAEFPGLAERIAAFVFLGTPHNGSSIAGYAMAIRYVVRSSSAVPELKRNNPELGQLTTWFRQSVQAFSWKVRVFYETLPTYGVHVVDRLSADPSVPGVTPVAIDADHFDICKPLFDDVRVKRTIELVAEVVASTEAGQTSRRISAGCFLYPPFSVWTDKDGSEVPDPDGGPWSELLVSVLARVKAQYVLTKARSSDFAEDAIGRADVIMGVFRTPDREKFYQFSAPLYRIGLNGVCKAERPVITREELGSGDLRVIVQKGEVGWEFARDQLPRVKAKGRLYVVDSPATYEAIDMLTSGNYDIAITDEISCGRFIERLGTKNPFRMAFGRPLNMFDVCFAVGKHLDWDIKKINELLVEIRNEPSFLRREGYQSQRASRRGGSL
jgi:pimeloyl-ACP methyl ester carboxylesterase